MDAYEENMLAQRLLVVTIEGLLKRLKTPFKALVLENVDELVEGKIYLVTAVYTSPDNIMQYAVRGHYYYYYYFVVIG